MKAIDKAWTYLRKTLKDDEKYFTLKNKEEPILVEGSQKGRYYIYPNGMLARIDKKKPFIGRVQAFTNMPLPDQLAAIYIWITKQEDKVKELWGCGNLAMYYDGKNMITENGLRLPTVTEVGIFGTCNIAGNQYRSGDDFIYYTT